MIHNVCINDTLPEDWMNLIEPIDQIDVTRFNAFVNEQNESLEGATKRQNLMAYILQNF